MKKIIFLMLAFCASSLNAQQANLDWKLHDIGNVLQVVTNRGGFNADAATFGYSRLVNSEHPLNSSNEHLTNAGLIIGGYANGIRSVSVADGENSPHEFFPTSEAWDTVWVVNRRDTVDIPYWPGYVGVSDQDFVCRYSDYGPVSQAVTDHKPLYVDVIQTSYAWSTDKLSETIVVTYRIIPRKYDLTNVYVGMYMNGNLGYRYDDNYGLDDESFYIASDKIMGARDVPGGSDGSGSMIGMKFFPPSNGGTVKATYVWWNGVKASPKPDDIGKYIEMSSGEIMENQVSTGDGTKSELAFGPYNIKVGDTLKLTVAFVFDDEKEGLIDKGKFAEALLARNFKVPSPPPVPAIAVLPGNKEIVLNWEPKPGKTNPEEFQDPDRGDGVSKPFEGYRIYKSTESATGPWSLLAQYDLSNDYAPNTGIQREYKAYGLLNNIEYYYTVTAYTLPDATSGFPEMESSKNAGAVKAIPGTPPPSTVGKVAVVPNPYRGDIAYNSYSPPWEKPSGTRTQWMEQDRRMQFINLPENCEIKIYTLAGDLIETIRHQDANKGYEDWNMTSSVGQAVSSGIYLYTVEDKKNGEVQVDKFVIIK